MKNRLILIIMIFAFSCKAQTIIKPLDGGGSCPYNPDCYEKDVNNDFDKFVGEWQYQSGNTSITLKLKKELFYQTEPNTNYEDLLVGEYQYIENGVEKANTLADFNNTSITGYQHKISGGILIRNLPNYCIDNSTSQEIKVLVYIVDSEDEFKEGKLILRHVIENGTEKLQVCIYDATTLSQDPNGRLPIPDGYYEFVKQ